MPGQSVRSRMAAASSRVRRLRRIDRAAVAVITFGGIAIVVAVLGILVFVAVEALPLFRGATLRPAGEVRISTALAAEQAASFRAFGVDEYRRYAFTVEPTGVVAFHRLDSGAAAASFPVPELGVAQVRSACRGVPGALLAAGLSDGRAALMQVVFRPEYEGERLRDVAADLRPRAVITLDPAGRAITQIAYHEQDDLRVVAGLAADGTVVASWTTADAERHAALESDGRPFTHVRLGRNGALIAGDEGGVVRQWELGDEPRLLFVSRVGSTPITALDWMLGGNSWVAATADGSVSGWLRAPSADGPDTVVRAHGFAPQPSPAVAIAISARDRSFVTVGRAGDVVLRHQTSERVLGSLPGAGPLTAVAISPKADALLALEGRTLRSFTLDNPHPEISWTTLFRKVWYEGYGHPEHVWQSTAATDDVEPKFSLVPLLFGTIKGTLYAMLFAVPIAVLAALYTSQFATPALRAQVKPAVEIMAALPSVVIGFLAGLYLASLVERHLVAVFVMIPLVPLAGTAGVLLPRLLPRGLQPGPGREVLVILPLLVLGIWLAVALGPPVEAWLFAGDARLWLRDALGLTYDQRNCLVVGIAMGFAVIPIIFTISEDALSSVPASLPAASLALGASRWQTAVRVVLPTASPGIFSAIMIGFGRAVGETMIVLMATGNTPLMDWSIFNGIRTLSANIAVEIPEAPQGGTLYRTLFLTAALLFVLTFIVNTGAEIIRQRLRQRYRAL